MTIYYLIGLPSVFIILLTYALLQLGVLRITGLVYSVLNIIGSLGIIISLMYKWNLPAFLVESAWALISVFGVWKYFTRKKLSYVEQKKAS